MITFCDINNYCPYGEPTSSMMWCRNCCGIGVDDSSGYEEDDYYEPDDSNIEVGYDPYSGCYTDDC